jgi:hypothetical protein
MFQTIRLMFRYAFGEPLPEIPEFDADRAAPDPAALEARERARHGDWHAAHKVIEDAGQNWELRGHRVSVLSQLAQKQDGWLYAWLAAVPDDPTAVLLQAEMLHGRAGAARGSASAAETTPEQFRDFHALSEAAAQVGRRAMELAPPGDPLPYAQMLGTLFGDQEARAGAFDELFDEGRRRDPYNFDLHWTAISLRCQKWGGSHEAMFSTARGVAEIAPPGAAAVMLPFLAHAEYVLLEFAWGNDTKKSEKAAKKYFARPEVRQELDHWLAKWRAGTPSPLKLSTCLQLEAFYYVLTDRRKEAKAIFDQLGQYVSPLYAWGYIWNDREAGYLIKWMWANRI